MATMNGEMSLPTNLPHTRHTSRDFYIKRDTVIKCFQIVTLQLLQSHCHLFILQPKSRDQ